MASRSPINPPPARPQESPSIPMSVYRELAGELQVARARANVLKSKNQQLAQHNIELRQEIVSLATAVEKVRVLAERGDDDRATAVSLPMPQLSFEREELGAAPNAPLPRPPQPAAAKKSAGIAAPIEAHWVSWLRIAIVLATVVLFSGLGFAIVRPILRPEPVPQHSS